MVIRQRIISDIISAIVIVMFLLLALAPPLSSSLLVALPSSVSSNVRHTTNNISPNSSSSISRIKSIFQRSKSRSRSSMDTTTAVANHDGNNNEATGNEKPLPRELLPITMCVFAQMISEGISLSSLPLYLTKLGASPISVGLAISCFSIGQMTFAPIAVGLSSRIKNNGRSIVLRICLAGAACSSLIIAFSGNVQGVIAGRTLAGIFAACVPVAQSSVTDILPNNQTALGLSRVSAAAQLGVVIGPLASATFQEGFETIIGIPSTQCLPAVFILNACNAMIVLALMTFIDRRQQRNNHSSKITTIGSTSTRQNNNNNNNNNSKVAVTTPKEESQDNNNKQSSSSIDDSTTKKSTTTLKENVSDSSNSRTTSTNSRMLQSYSQPILRTITIIVGWTAILSNSIYGLFAPRFMGFGQSQLSATYSVAAMLMVITQILFPRIVAKIGGGSGSGSGSGGGEHRACSVGILAVATGIGGQSLIRIQPFHSILYMINRIGAAIADTSTAALVASSSTDRDNRSKNLALLTSTRAAARIFTPLLSSKMFELSCRRSSSTSSSLSLLVGGIPRGALPFVTASFCCLAAAPLPFVLCRAERRAESRSDRKEKLTL